MRVIRRFAGAVGVALALSVAAAPAASAHALLLRTDPSPQTTVVKAPASVRLFFSEPVEVAVGSIRVFDVDGIRVDTGKVRHGAQRSEVDAAVKHLKAGTYTVTWRVISADSHPVHGGFQFFVEHPSTISPKAIAGETGAGRVVGWGFGTVRFMWFAGLLGIIGAVVARRWVWTPSLRATGTVDTPAADLFRRWWSRLLVGAWVGLLVGGVLALWFQAANVSALGLLSSIQFSLFREVLKTTFGHLWWAELALTLALLVPVVGLARGRRLWGVAPDVWIVLTALLTTGLAVAEALNGHARTDAHPAIEVPSVAVHLLAVGVWVGGLAVLALVGIPAWRRLDRSQRSPVVRQVVRRFSRLAVVGVAVVVATGIVNAIGDFHAVSDLWRITYGRIVLAKLALLAVALLLAARHRFVLPGRLADAARGEAAVGSFERTGRVESVVLAGAVALAAALVALVPGRTLALAASGPVNQDRAVGGYTAQVFIDPTAVGPNEVHVTFVNPQGLAAGEVTNANVTITPPHGRPAPIAMRLISFGHFVGDATLPDKGTYHLRVQPGGGPTTTIKFNLKKEKS